MQLPTSGSLDFHDAVLLAQQVELAEEGVEEGEHSLGCHLAAHGSEAW